MRSERRGPSRCGRGVRSDPSSRITREKSAWAGCHDLTVTVDDGGVLADDGMNPIAVDPTPHIAGASRAGWVVVAVNVLLIHPGKHHVGADERDDLDGVVDRTVDECSRKYLTGELADRLSPDQPTPAPGHPSCGRVEQGKEAFGVLLPLASFEFGNTSGQTLRRRTGARLMGR